MSTSPTPADRDATPADALSALKPRYLDAVRAEADAAGGALAGVGLWATIVLSALTLVLLPLSVTLYRRLRAARAARAPLREAVRFAERATAVMACPLGNDPALRRPGVRAVPALVLVCFDPDVGTSVRFMTRVAAQVWDAVDQDEVIGLSDADRAFCEYLFADDEFVPHRRRKLPAAVTGGPDVYACDLMIVPQLLPGRHVSDALPMLPCAAEPGDAGRIAQVPFWLLPGAPAPAEEERQHFTLSLLSMPARG